MLLLLLLIVNVVVAVVAAVVVVVVVVTARIVMMPTRPILAVFLVWMVFSDLPNTLFNKRNARLTARIWLNIARQRVAKRRDV